jgi:hypothetical protein
VGLDGLEGLDIPLDLLEGTAMASPYTEQHGHVERVRKI